MLNNIQLSQCNFVININSKTGNITQNQYGNSDPNLENTFLKKEIEFLRSQLEFSQNLIQKLLTGKEGINA